MSIFGVYYSQHSVYSSNSTSSSSSSSTSDPSELVSTSDDTNSDVDSNYDSDDENMLEDIYFHEEEFLNSEKVDNHYYIGINKVSDDKQYILYANAITNHTFFRYDIKHVTHYLQEYSIFACPSNMDVMKLSILDDYTYSVILKTYWLRIIQRHWKKIYSQRLAAIKKRAQLQARMYFEIHGRYPDNSYIIPTIHGMLVSYNTNLLLKCH